MLAAADGHKRVIGIDCDPHPIYIIPLAPAPSGAPGCMIICHQLFPLQDAASHHARVSTLPAPADTAP